MRVAVQHGLRAAAGASSAVWRGDELLVLGALDGVVDIFEPDAPDEAHDTQLLTPVPRRHRFTTSPLAPEVLAGKRLFYSATNSAMGVGGVSCSTCHFEGRTDGLTWTFETDTRQTPSLAGVVSTTAPVTWSGQVASVADEADITTRGRMGGSGLTDDQLQSIAAYVDSTPLAAPATVDADLVARGYALFVRSDAGCYGCHGGDQLTDREVHVVNGKVRDTPSLLGLAGSGPYMSDGSSRTVRDVLERAREPGFMGDTSMLTDEDLDALEAFLLSR
ncbi:MAG: c-type cytochrome [Myxococcales bacterium]|nr:c-type cytochrome [Myxococcales bacterium]